MTLNETRSSRLRRLFLQKETLMLPFGAMPIHAQMAERAGFEAFELSGGISAWYYGVSDVGLLTQTEVVEHAEKVARSVEIPIFADADTGYGSPLNVRRTVKDFIHAGVSGIHLEDQMSPKKSGGASGIHLASDAEAIGRLAAAVSARDECDPEFVLVARTDAYGALGGSLEEAIRRCNLYMQETGVDLVYIEGVKTWEEARFALSAIDGPAYIFMARDATYTPTPIELTGMGQAMQPLRFILPGVQEVWDLLLRTRDSGSAAPIDEYRIKSFELGGERFTGYGDAFAKPTFEEVRRIEETYTPRNT